MIAFLLFGSMALFLALGVPIAFSLGLSTLIGCYIQKWLN